MTKAINQICCPRSQLVQWYSYARNANIPISVSLQTQKLFEDAQLALVLKVYGEYDQREANARYLDYDDILWRCAAILTQRKDVRDRIVYAFATSWSTKSKTPAIAVAVAPRLTPKSAVVLCGR
jgi:ATP-dependent exoDNAse (exonuclease V) beta subunit